MKRKIILFVATIGPGTCINTFYKLVIKKSNLEKLIFKNYTTFKSVLDIDLCVYLRAWTLMSALLKKAHPTYGSYGQSETAITLTPPTVGR